jgi:hypothetical protein
MIKKALLLIASLVLAGCASIPTQLDIQSGPDIAPEAQQEFAYYTPSGPSFDATSQEIVSGFLAAGTSPLNDYAVAREFLSDDFAQRWNPENQTVIRAGAPVFRQAGESLVVVELSAGARIDDQGRYEDSVELSTTNLRFRVALQDGQWRISSAPNLTVVTPPVFSVVFNAFPVYFLDSSMERLVPDLRWFPTRTSTPTRLVNALLAGPSAWLSSGVKSAIPEGTQLTISAVRILNRVAQVDLDGDALAAGQQDRRNMLGQLRSTLLQLPGVDDISLSVNGAFQDIAPGGAELNDEMSLSYVLTPTGVEPLTSVGSMPLSGTQAMVANYNPELIAITDNGDRIAFTTAEGVFELTNQSLRVEIIQLSSLIDVVALDYDKSGSLWAFPTDASLPVEVYDQTTVVRTLASPFLGARLAAAIAPEGTRVVQSIQTDDAESFLDVGVVLRDANSIPLALNKGLTIRPVLGTPIAVSWQGMASIRVLETTASGLTAFSEYSISGPRTQLPMPPTVGIELHAAASATSSYMLSEVGEVWLFSANSWRRIETGVTSISPLR